jgi:hypothetical protein
MSPPVVDIVFFDKYKAEQKTSSFFLLASECDAGLRKLREGVSFLMQGAGVLSAASSMT